MYERLGDYDADHIKHSKAKNRDLVLIGSSLLLHAFISRSAQAARRKGFLYDDDVTICSVASGEVHLRNRSLELCD